VSGVGVIDQYLGPVSFHAKKLAVGPAPAVFPGQSSAVNSSRRHGDSENRVGSPAPAVKLAQHGGEPVLGIGSHHHDETVIAVDSQVVDARAGETQVELNVLGRVVG